jgi:predicted nucleic acid-binding protein
VRVLLDSSVLIAAYISREGINTNEVVFRALDEQ